jgi:hypothetical protein
MMNPIHIVVVLGYPDVIYRRPVPKPFRPAHRVVEEVIQ